MRSMGFVVAAMLAALCSAARAQTPAWDVQHRRPMYSVEEALQRHHIPLTTPALLEALQNSDPEVRSLAAQKLAKDKATETIPAILHALTSEKVDRTRVVIASSLAQLGEPKGFSALQEACADHTMPPFLRINAARYMIYFLGHQDQTCRKGLFEILHSEPDPDSLRNTVSLLRQFQDLSEAESQQVVQVLLRALASPNPSRRVVASIVLGEIGGGSEIPHLQRAIAKEKDDVVRSQMQADLQRISQKSQE